MADMDWGWKRKKRTGKNDNTEDASDEETITEEELNRLIDFHTEEELNRLIGILSQRNGANEDDVEVSKRYVGSVLRNEKKSIASLARSNEVGDDVKVGQNHLIMIKPSHFS